MEQGHVDGRGERIGWVRHARLMFELAAVPRRAMLPASPVREDPASPRRWAMLASERYSLPILRPLAERARARGDHVAWIVRDALAPMLGPDEARVRSFAALRAFAPDAVFATVDRIPPWLPGLQVQLFHGLNLHKRDPSLGQFRMQDLYDLYCTHGPTDPRPRSRCTCWRKATAGSWWRKPDGRSSIRCSRRRVRARMRCAAPQPDVRW